MRVDAYRVLGVVLGCVVVAGCASDGADDPVTLPPSTSTATPEPSETSSPRPTSTPTPSGDPTPTTTLVLPDEHVESVDAFVVEFFAALNAAKDSGDFSAFDAMYLPQCTGCMELRDEVVGWLEGGQTVEGGDWVILQQSSTEFPDGSTADLVVLTYREAAQLLDGTASVASDLPATAPVLFTGSLLPDDPWILEDVGYSEAP